MEINFEKWQGLGNDFIILEKKDAKFLTPETAEKMCSRNFGIGADGIFAPTQSDIANIGWVFYNSDGSIAQMCGNGIRCFAKYVFEHDLVSEKEFKVETLAGIIAPKILDNGNVSVNMGKPEFRPEKIPVKVENGFDFKIEGFEAFAVSMGNPHCVIYTEEDGKKLAGILGPKIETNPVFPEKTNVEFVNIINKSKIKMNVWERGCGITLACGTGACASAVCGVHKGLIDNVCEVVLPGGILKITYYDNEPVYMEGPAKKVFTGKYII